jgi:hypothetical protein
MLSSLELVSTNNKIHCVTKQMGLIQMNICTFVVWEQTSYPILNIYKAHVEFRQGHNSIHQRIG